MSICSSSNRHLHEVFPSQSLLPSETSLLKLLLSPPLLLPLQVLQSPQLQLSFLMGIRLQTHVQVRQLCQKGDKQTIGLSAYINQMAYLLCVHLSVHCALRHVVVCGSEGIHIRFLYYMWLFGIDVLLEQENTL